MLFSEADKDGNSAIDLAMLDAGTLAEPVTVGWHRDLAFPLCPPPLTACSHLLPLSFSSDALGGLVELRRKARSEMAGAQELEATAYMQSLSSSAWVELAAEIHDVPVTAASAAQPV